MQGEVFLGRRVQKCFFIAFAERDSFVQLQGCGPLFINKKLLSLIIDDMFSALFQNELYAIVEKRSLRWCSLSLKYSVLL